jgi:hypothetical protein
MVDHTDIRQWLRMAGAVPDISEFESFPDSKRDILGMTHLGFANPETPKKIKHLP